MREAGSIATRVLKTGFVIGQWSLVIGPLIEVSGRAASITGDIE
jgi:hypothetical protein